MIIFRRSLAAASLLGFLLISCGKTPVLETPEPEALVLETPEPEALVLETPVQETLIPEVSPIDATVGSFLKAVKQGDAVTLKSFGCLGGLEPSGTETLAGLQDWQIKGSKLKAVEQNPSDRYVDTSVEVNIAAMGTTMQGTYIVSVWSSEEYYQHLLWVTNGISNPQREGLSQEPYCITKIEMF